MIRLGISLAGFVVVGLLLWFIASSLLGYWLENVAGDQVGVLFQGNRRVAVVGPGLNTDRERSACV